MPQTLDPTDPAVRAVATPDPVRLPANAYTPAGARRDAMCRRAGRQFAARGHLALRRLGPAALRRLHRRLGLLGAEGRAGDGGGDPDLDPRDRPGARVPAALDAARERHPHRHRRHVRRGRRRRGLHAAGALHAELQPAPGADDLHLPGRRLPRRALPHPAAPLLRARDARRIPLPGGHGHHRGARHRRDAAARRRGCCCRRRRSPASTTSSSRPSRCGASSSTCSSCPRSRRSPTARAWPLSFDAVAFILGPRLRDGPAVVDGALRRRRPLEPRARAADLDGRPAPAGRRGLPGHRAHRAHDRRRRSSAATCASSASARSPPPASSASSSRCAIVVGSFADRGARVPARRGDAASAPTATSRCSRS